MTDQKKPQKKTIHLHSDDVSRIGELFRKQQRYYALALWVSLNELAFRHQTSGEGFEVSYSIIQAETGIPQKTFSPLLWKLHEAKFIKIISGAHTRTVNHYKLLRGYYAR